MSEKEKLLRKVSQVDFALFELHLFLDTHPHDQAALNMYNKYMKESAALHLEFTSKYGPLNTKDVNTGNMWQWIKDPWPWDYSREEGL